MRKSSLFTLIAIGVSSLSSAQSSKPVPTQIAPTQIDRDLFEVTVPKLESLYAAHKYTITQVVEWHLARIHRYNGIYRPVETVMEKDALAQAAKEDAESSSASHGPLWGIPIVIKANTSIKGQITTDGWAGYIIPRKQLIAPQDATVVARLRAAGAILIGHTNMPDFAASDTNRSSSFGRTGNAYDVRFSPGGSSGGTVTAVTSDMAVLGNGTDTGNSIRMPSATSAVIGVFPTRGLVSTAGIAPLDWLLDNTGPIARNVTDAAIALDVMAGIGSSGHPTPDPADPRTADSATKAERGPYTNYLKPGSLKGKRFGVPSFILHGRDVPFQGLAATVSADAAETEEEHDTTPLRPETRAAFLKSIEALRAAGAEIVFDDNLLPDSFAKTASRVGTLPYIREGTESFLKNYGPSYYHSIEEYEKFTGHKIPEVISGYQQTTDRRGLPAQPPSLLESDPSAQANYYDPREKTLQIYLDTLDRYHLDAYVYPATQMPPPDETMPQDGGISGGPHSETSWANIIGVPAVVVVGGWYPGGLPFGLEISTRPWHDGDLLSWAYDYEQHTHYRHPPVLVQQGLLPNAP
ncbi:amidase [Acidicapsa dinghuensis]|uniref:Amidase n=1 Tax=Acidicapsa dinghuensis TaxID=2218256 RepID=A0ABW1E9W2_9BACT|nr:amidase [Acidicapsa dinghuensis]